MGITITTLAENTAGVFGMVGEWGLSIHIEAYGRSILLDTGPSALTLHNAGKLGIDLSGIDTIVISHGHIDHTGGLLDTLLQIQESRRRTGMLEGVDIVAHPDIFTLKYACRQGTERFIGLPFSIDALEAAGGRFLLTKEPVKLQDNIWTTGEVPLITDYEQVGAALCIKEAGIIHQDPLADDQALVMNTSSGLIVILGCAHRGMINTIMHARKVTGMHRVHMVLGGTHLFEASEEQLWLTIAALRELEVERLGVSHCTGLKPSVILGQEFGESFFFNNAGTRVTIPV